MHNVSLSAAQGFVLDFPANFVHEAQGRLGRSHLWGGPISTSTPPRRRMFSKSTPMLPMATAVQPRPWDERRGIGWGGHGMIAALPYAGREAGPGASLPMPGAMPCQPFRRRRRRQRSDTPPLLGGGLCLSGFLGPIYPDKTRQNPTNTQKRLSAVVLFADAAFCRRAFCDNSHNPLNPLGLIRFGHFA